MGRNFKFFIKNIANMGRLCNNSNIGGSKMTVISDRISKKMKEKAFSYGELSKITGISKSVLQRYATGETEKIPINRIEIISKALGCSAAYLMGWDEFPTPYNVVRKKGVKIPVLGVIPAGIPIEAIEDIVDWEEIPIDWTKGGKEYFALQVKGDSMYPEYLPGDVVIVQKSPNCESGDDCVVYINGYDATLKKVIKNADNSITIRPLNANYPPQTFSAEEIAKLPVTIGGVVVELRRKKKG